LSAPKRAATLIIAPTVQKTPERFTHMSNVCLRCHLYISYLYYREMNLCSHDLTPFFLHRGTTLCLLLKTTHEKHRVTGFLDERPTRLLGFVNLFWRNNVSWRSSDQSNVSPMIKSPYICTFWICVIFFVVFRDRASQTSPSHPLDGGLFDRLVCSAASFLFFRYIITIYVFTGKLINTAVRLKQLHFSMEWSVSRCYYTYILPRKNNFRNWAFLSRVDNDKKKSVPYCFGPHVGFYVLFAGSFHFSTFVLAGCSGSCYELK
jgi:hypothetical protein